MKRRLFGFAAVLATLIPSLVSGPAGAVPIDSGFISSDNVELLATIPDTGATGGRFVQNGNLFVTTTSASFPLVPGPTSGLRIYDASSPETPILIGALPLPHAENEDVDVSESRKLILVSQDIVSSAVSGGVLYVIDFAISSAPMLKGVLRLPATVKTSDNKNVSGPGHIANCIADCARYSWVTGARNGSIFVVDLQNPALPTIVGTISQSITVAGRGNQVFKTGIVHDVNEDDAGNVWVTGSGGTAMLNASNPLVPTVLHATAPADNAALNQFIHHNSLRLNNETVMITEEDWQQPNCGQTQAEQGGFQTWRIPQTPNAPLQPLGQWITEVGRADEGTAPFIEYCSSHWFTFNSSSVVAVGWYNQGVRFLDVSDPQNIRQVGYWLGPLSMASAAIFVPGRRDIVYAVDYQRGIDVIRIAGGGATAATVTAPILPQWSQGSVDFGVRPHPVFGYACALPGRP